MAYKNMKKQKLHVAKLHKTRGVGIHPVPRSELRALAELKVAEKSKGSMPFWSKIKSIFTMALVALALASCSHDLYPSRTGFYQVVYDTRLGMNCDTVYASLCRYKKNAADFYIRDARYKNFVRVHYQFIGTFLIVAKDETY